MSRYCRTCKVSESMSHRPFCTSANGEHHFVKADELATLKAENERLRAGQRDAIAEFRRRVEEKFKLLGAPSGYGGEQVMNYSRNMLAEVEKEMNERG